MSSPFGSGFFGLAPFGGESEVVVPAPVGEASDVCWLGALGQMLPLPDVRARTDVPVERIGSIHRALGGGVTVDTFARKRSWVWQWERLLEKQTVFLEALQYGLVDGPLRMIDPRRPNRLPEYIAAGGSVFRSNYGYSTDAGSFAYWRPLTTASTADATTLPAHAMLRGFLEWKVAAPGSTSYLRAADTRYLDGRWRVPVLPYETLQVSMWAMGPTDSQVSLWVSELNVDGSSTLVQVADYLPMALNAWQELAGEHVIAPGVIAVTPYLVTDASHISPNDSIFTTAWSVTSKTLTSVPTGIIEHCDVPDLTAGWRIGGGGPYVVADVGANTYGELGFYGSALTVFEI